MKIKLWCVGDRVSFNRYKWSPIILSGRVVARYPDIGMVEVMDFKGHTWRVNCG